jgi:hypothetical protein
MRVESEAISDFAKIMDSTSGMTKRRDSKTHVNLDREGVKNGLGRLVLTLINLIHELLERQAIRRIETGDLTDAEIERLGMTLMLQEEEIKKISEIMGLKEEDLNLDLGPLGKLL